MDNSTGPGPVCLRSLVDAIPNPYMVVSLDRKVLFANQAAVALAGQIPEGLSFSEACEPFLGVVDSAPLDALCDWPPQKTSQRTRTVTLGHKNTEGAALWSEIAASPIVDEQGNVDKVLMIFRDVSEQVVTMQALQAAEERWKYSLQGARLGTWDWQVTTGRITTNDRWAQMLGFELEDFDYDISTWESLLHPDDRDRAVQTLQAHLDGKTRTYSSEHRLKHRDGHWIWILDTGHVIHRDADGRPLRAAGVHLDITDRKQFELDLFESKRRLSLFERANVIVFEMDLKSERFTYVSPQAETLLGYPQSQWYQKNFWPDHIHPADREAATTTCATAVARAEDHDFTYRMLAADGREVWIRDVVTIITDEQDNPTDLVGAMIDISTQRLLGETQEQLSTVIDGLPVVLWALDQDGIFTLSEGKGLASLNLKPGQAVGLSVFELYQDFPDILAPIRRCLDGEEISVETEFQGLHWESLYNPRRDPDGTVVGMGALSLDITQRKEAERQKGLLETKILQAQKLESLGVLAGGIAHDFNNLLVGILGNAELAMMDLPLDSPLRENMRGIITASKRSADLAQQMLAYSGRGHFLIQSVDLSVLVQEMAHLLEVAISKDVVIRYELNRSLNSVEVDITQIRQVVMNLITNASDSFLGNAGTITLRTGEAYCDSVYLQSTQGDKDLQGGPYVFFEVEDNGSGMDDETQARIFDPFFTTKDTGRGLGLAATLGIMRGHHGAINVTSIPQIGTVIRVLFPVSTTVAHTIPSTEATETLKGSGTVLVVDDEEVVRTTAANLLKRFGFEVITAANGQEAVDIYRAQGSKIAAVLLDLTMPKMNGVDTFTELLRLDPEVAVVIASGFSEETIQQQFHGKSLKGFVAKPFNPHALVEAISRAASIKGQS